MTFRLARLLPLIVLFASAITIQAQPNTTLTVFAAASLTDAFTEIGADFEALNPNIDVVFNFGGSSTLAAQIVEGAPADVFASANVNQMTVVQDSGRITDEPEIFAQNRLVVIVPADNPANITTLDDLANQGVLLVVAAPGVPVREYTDTMLDRLAAAPEYGASYRDAVRANIVSEEDNVRQVAAKVALGEADAGIVYLSDVTPDIADDVLTLPIPDAYNTIATYPIAALNDSPNLDAARAFVEYVLSREGQAVLTQWGLVSILPSITVNGQPRTLEDIRTLTPYTVEITRDGITTAYTGALLWEVIDAPENPVNRYIVVTARDGSQIVFSGGELSPEYLGYGVILAYAPLDGLTLIAPDDSRSLSDVVSVSVRDLGGE